MTSKITILITLFFFTISLQAAQDAQASSAKDVIGRLIGPRIENCRFVIEKSSTNEDFYEFSASNGILTVKGNNGVSLCRGAYDYLRSIGSVQAAWQQSVVKLPKSFPDTAPTRLASPCEMRLFLNVCQYGYTSPYWQWADWEKMLDWMALHGYDSAPVMCGQEIIWYELFADMGVSKKEMDAYFAGASYLPWQRMGNIGSVKGPLPMSYLLKQKEIQKKIINRMLGLGMTPVAPGFSGFVPEGLAKVHPESKIKPLGWRVEKKNAYLLDMQDNLFRKIGTEFVKRYRATYGDVHYFLSDTFNENKVNVSKEPVKRAEELAGFGDAVYQSIKAADPDGVWVTQGWMFLHDQHFWSAENVKSLFAKIPDDKVLIIDYGNDRGVIWKRLGAYGGKRWLFGYINNYGGVTPLQGDISLVASEPAKLRHRDDIKNLSGFAFCPEASHLNYVLYAVASDASWSKDPLDVAQWLKNYSENRYGIHSAQLEQVWEILEKNVYNVKYWSARNNSGWGSFYYNKLPTDNTNVKLSGNPGSLDQALESFFSESQKLKDQPLYKRDALDFTRHFLEARADKYLKIAIQTRNDKNPRKHNDARAIFTEILTDLDDLLAASPEHSLNSWLTKAAAFGETPEEKLLHLKSARQQVSTWSDGTHLNGYASKGWHGMIKDFYLKRWELWLDNHKVKNPNKKFLRTFERQWVNNPSIPEIKINKNITAECHRLYKKYLPR